jgi:tRNA modification GTPase
VNNLKGELSKKITSIRDGLMDILMRIEASIDFSEEEDVDKKGKKDIFGRLNKAKRDMGKLISESGEGRILRYGVKTVICGSPNVGKSSLMNALLKESRAIVTHLPGTTRDTIEEAVDIKGIPVVLVDTAGINDTDHPIEKEGVRRSHLSLQNADLILFVMDYGRKINRNDSNIASDLKDNDNVIAVINKNDLKRRIDVDAIKKLLPKRPIIYTSAIKMSGIEELEKAIKTMVFKGKTAASDFAGISNDRQLNALRQSYKEVNTAISSYKDKAPMDCIGIYLRSAIENLGEMTGHTITEEALDRIFSEFCIGK